MNYFFKKTNGKTIVTWLECQLNLQEGFKVLLQINKKKEGEKPKFDYFTILHRIFTEDKCIVIVEDMIEPFERPEEEVSHVH